MVAGASAVDLKRGLDRGLRVAVAALKDLSRPVKVVGVALENAVSVASLLLLTLTEVADK